MTTEVLSDDAPKPMGLYPHARRVGNLLFLSGIGARNPATDEVPGNVYDKTGNVIEYNIEAQCRMVFQNVRTILEQAGAAWEDLVDVTVFLTDMENDFGVYNRVYAEHFGDVRPCRTTVGINKLPSPIAIELKCIATINK